MDFPDPLESSHDLGDFDCGVEELNSYLKRYAGQSQKREGARTYVLSENGRVIAYYTILFGGIEWAEAPDEVRNGLGKYPIPIMIIARLAVDKRWSGQGFGSGLLIDALRRGIVASEIAGLRAVCVDAKDDAAKKFYERNGFRTWPVGRNRLFVTMTELKKTIEK